MAADIQIMQGRKTNGGVIVSHGLKPPFTEDITKNIINLDGVKSSHVFYSQTYRNPGASSDSEYIEQGYIIGVDDEVMKEILGDLFEVSEKLSLSDFYDPANVISSRYFWQDNIIGDVIYNSHSLNSDFNVNLQDITDDEPTGQTSLHVAGTANLFDLPRYIEFPGGLPIFFLPISSFEKNEDLNPEIYGISLEIDGEKYDSIAAALDKICEDEGNIHYKSFMAMKKEIESQIMNIIILIMAGLGIVFAVSILNLVSTTFIGIEQRKKELGVLSALGLGSKELKTMLKWEGIWVSMFSTLISITGGCFMGYLFYLWIDSMGGDYINLSFPVIPAVIFCLIYVFAPYIITSAGVRRLLKNTTVELLGQEI